jgi:iron complex outermembrane receptor protein
MTVTDSRILDSGKPINYQQNIGKASGYGFELGTNVFFSDWLTFYINPVYNHLTYDGNITYSGTTLSTDGRQIVDVPRWTVSTGLIFKYKNFEVIPQMKYLGKRYGDCEHKEEISSYALFGLKFSYVKEKAWFSKTFVVSLELDNVFNKKYVSVINAMDDAVTGTTYGVGPPFTVRGLVSFKF